MVRAIYRFICDVILACLWLVAGVLSFGMVLVLFLAAIVAALLGCLIFSVMWVRDSPKISTEGKGLSLKL